jgi:hypothetical protein
MNARTLGLLLALCLLAAPRGARAFCNAMTCNTGDASQHCQIDTKTQCVRSGQPVFWKSRCVTFSVQRDAAPRAGIDYEAATASLERAFAAWTSADCDGKPPSLHFQLSEPVTCAASEYNKERRNANIVYFREDEWPYEGGEDALGLTRISFDPDVNVGELWDTDIEINAVSEPLSAGEPASNEVDLDSLLTHEVGHALGLGHSLDMEATMIAGYETGSIGLRSLGADDVAGVCSIYPPDRDPGSDSCEPRHGFSELCAVAQPEPDSEPTSSSDTSSCSLTVSGRDATPNGGGLAAWLVAIGAVALGCRRKSARSVSASTTGRHSV